MAEAVVADARKSTKDDDGLAVFELLSYYLTCFLAGKPEIENLCGEGSDDASSEVCSIANSSACDMQRRRLKIQANLRIESLPVV